MKKWVTFLTMASLFLVVTSSNAASKKQLALSDEFTFQGMIDVMAFNMTNAGLTESSDWYFYPVYRTIVSKSFTRQNFMILADVEKPGYANITYPFIKVNELYAKFQESSFYVKLGRQQFGDKDDLLLGLQNDAVSMGFDLSGFDIMVFFAKTNLITPWATGGAIESLVGAIPTFDLGSNMKLDLKLLIGNEPITITPITTPASQPEDSINTLIQTGGRFDYALPVGHGASLDIAAQLGVQIGMARVASDHSIDATSLGMKLDAEYGMGAENIDFKIGGHLIYTGGHPEPGVNTKAGFASLNALPGAGPGMFSKIEDGAGPYTYVDAHVTSGLIRNLVGLMSAGLTAEAEIGQFIPGIGLWFYSDTNKDGKSLGMEFNQSLVFKVSNSVSFYQQLAYYAPNRDGLEQRGLWTGPTTPDPKAATKLLIGSSINF